MAAMSIYIDPEIPGLFHVINIITPEAERVILQELDAGVWSNDLKRRTQQFGYGYPYKGAKLSNLLPDRPIVGTLANLTNYLNSYLSTVVPLINGGSIVPIWKPFDRIICNEYVGNQGITPHTDDSQLFGPVVAGLSLGSGVSMNFSFEGRDISRWLAPRSLFVMTGDARYRWKHGIAVRMTMIDAYGQTVKRDPNFRRVSITFRSGA